MREPEGQLVPRASRRRLRPWAAGALLAVACAAGGARAAAGAAAPLVVLDPGHGPVLPGAIGVRGRAELEYNDALVALLEPRLVRAGFRVEVTRRPGQELDLDARAARAAGAWLFLSIHHDSAQERYLAREDRDGREAWCATRPIRGWQLFVSGLGPRYGESVRAAKALGRHLLALGRAPTLHHAEPIPGENRPLLDATLGIYRFDEVKVLRLAPSPAVLLEAGVLVDEVDEAYVSDPARREAMVGAIVAALVELRGKG